MFCKNTLKMHWYSPQNHYKSNISRGFAPNPIGGLTAPPKPPADNGYASSLRSKASRALTRAFRASCGLRAPFYALIAILPQMTQIHAFVSGEMIFKTWQPCHCIFKSSTLALISRNSRMASQSLEALTQWLSNAYLTIFLSLMVRE